jgi:hypothetical protein
MSKEREELRGRIQKAVQGCLLDLWWNFDIGSDELRDDQSQLNQIANSLEQIAMKAYERNHPIDA